MESYQVGSCLGGELSWWDVVLVDSCPGGKLSWWRVVLVGSCLGGVGGELSW